MEDPIKRINDSQPGREQADEFVRQVRLELKRQNGQWKRLERISGGELTHNWIVQFAGAQIVTPHIDKLMMLAVFLGFRVKIEAGSHYNRFAP